jgi:hypothetical protein
MSTSTYHTHHIIPKHAGGTNEPSNLVRLTVTEHAEAHRLLYEQYGKVQDKTAWLMLSAQINKPAGAFTGHTHSAKSRLQMSAAQKGRPKTQAHKQKIRQANLGHTVNNETREILAQAHRRKALMSYNGSTPLLINNIKAFCQEYNLSYASIKNLLNPKRNHWNHRGWAGHYCS